MPNKTSIGAGSFAAEMKKVLAISMTAHGLHDGPHSPGLTHGMTLGGAGRRNFLENPHSELFYEVEVETIGRSVGGECGEPESNLGSLLCELIHVIVPTKRRHGAVR